MPSIPLESALLNRRPTWAAFVPRSAAAQLAAFRTSAALSGCETADGLWVRCDSSDPKRNVEVNQQLGQQLRLQVGAELFEIAADQALIPIGCRVPFPSGQVSRHRHRQCGHQSASRVDRLRRWRGGDGRPITHPLATDPAGTGSLFPPDDVRVETSLLGNQAGTLGAVALAVKGSV